MPSGASKDWDRRVGRAADAWDAQIRQEEAAGGGHAGGGGMVRGRDAVQGTQQQQQQAQAHTRHEFEQNLLKQAQGLWSMLQGKGGKFPGSAPKHLLARTELPFPPAVDFPP